jgi:membrane protein DedA with SNARE-associated domain
MHEFAQAVGIVLGTFVLEDAAIVSAALLAAEGLIAPPLALTALYIGIFAGDLGLYGLGYLASRHKGLRHWIGEGRIRLGRRWLKRRLWTALIAARFLPGFRLPTYTASGYLHVSFGVFLIVAAAAAGVWSTAVFSAVYIFGEMTLPQMGPWRWAVSALLVLAIVVAPHLITLRRMRAEKALAE